MENNSSDAAERRAIHEIKILISIAAALDRLDLGNIVSHLRAPGNMRVYSDNAVVEQLAVAFKTALPAIKKWKDRGIENFKGIQNAEKN